MRFPTRNLAPFVIILAGLGPGCDGRPPVDSSKTEATVTGTVLVKGKPAKAGEIRFDPSNVDRLVGPRSAPIGPDGTYTIKTYTGGNQIGFAGRLASENPGLFRFKEYFEVQRGENKKNFDLLKESQGAYGSPKSKGRIPQDAQAASGPAKSRGRASATDESTDRPEKKFRRASIVDSAREPPTAGRSKAPAQIRVAETPGASRFGRRGSRSRLARSAGSR